MAPRPGSVNALASREGSPPDMTHEQAVATMATERYLLDEMSEPDRRELEAHYFACEICAEDVRTPAMLKDGARAFLGEHGRPRAAPMATAAAHPPRPRFPPPAFSPCPPP